MSTNQMPILFLGATGYLGGTVLSRLLAHPNASKFDITALVRSSEKAELLKEFGVKAVVGSLANEDTLASLAEQAHCIFSLANNDDVPPMKAILRGMKKRHDTIGDIPSLVHTSGTGVLYTNDKGMFPSETVYDDTNIEQMASLAPTQIHRNVDLTILEADEEGYMKSFIILPGTIYGRATNSLVKAGIAKDHSEQIPKVIEIALARGEAGMTGKGLALWANVDIDEAADLYIVLCNGIVGKNPAVTHGKNGYYFAENGEHSWYELTKEIAKILFALGKAKSDEPTTFATEELAKYFGFEMIGLGYGTNARCIATHSRAIGWNPQKTTKDMLASIKPEVEAIIKEKSAQ